MAARRIVLAAGSRGPATCTKAVRAGAWAHCSATSRRCAWSSSNVAGRLTFKAGGDAERELLKSLPAMLDKIDAWVTAGVLSTIWWVLRKPGKISRTLRQNLARFRHALSVVYSAANSPGRSYPPDIRYPSLSVAPAVPAVQ